MDRLGRAMVMAAVLALAVPTAAWGFGNGIHKDMTAEALPFLDGGRLDDINDEHLWQETAGGLDETEHFDDCAFEGGAGQYNSNFADMLAQAAPDEQDWGDLSDQFGQGLHGAQDFYAHSNWVELATPGDPAVGKRLIDEGHDFWSEMTPYSLRHGAMFVQGEDETPFGDDSLSRVGHVVTVNTPTGSRPGIISGSFGFTDDCPDNVTLDHGDLNKDDADRAGFAEAYALALAQTRHEWYRAVSMIHEAHGPSALEDVLDEFVKDDDSSQEQLQDLFVEHDVIPPQITCPADRTLEANRLGGATGSLGAFAASDKIVANRSQIPLLSSDRPAVLPLGATTVTYTATDRSALPGRGPNESSCEQQVTVVDTTPPVTTAALTPPTPDGGEDWFRVPVQVCLEAVDVAWAATTVEYRLNGGAWLVYGGCFFVNADAAEHVVEFRSSDPSGNVEPVRERRFKIDRTAPLVDFGSSCPSQVNLQQPASVQVAVTDALSGVASQSVADGTHSLPTNEPGEQQFTVLARDVAGNSTTAACTYRVVYDFEGAGGFAAPVDDDGINHVVSPQVVRLRWSLPNGDGGFITDLDAVEALEVEPADCVTWMAAGERFAAASAGRSGLRTVGSGYEFNWQTRDLASGSCVRFVLSLDDGSEHTARFVVA